jgi:large subunit ribosomal protein L21
MYAIVEIAGKQYKVEQEKFIYANKLDQEIGTKLDFDKVYLVDNNGEVKIGLPTVAGAKVVATVLEHVKDDKVIIFKKKRRKGYQKQTGHRQKFTKLQIEAIVA